MCWGGGGGGGSGLGGWGGAFSCPSRGPVDVDLKSLPFLKAVRVSMSTALQFLFGNFLLVIVTYFFGTMCVSY